MTYGEMKAKLFRYLRPPANHYSSVMYKVNYSVISNWIFFYLHSKTFSSISITYDYAVHYWWYISFWTNSIYTSQFSTEETNLKNFDRKRFTFFSSSYLHQNWAKFFEITESSEQFFQDTWIELNWVGQSFRDHWIELKSFFNEQNKLIRFFCWIAQLCFTPLNKSLSSSLFLYYHTLH
jgi:hypothetical protein